MEELLKQLGLENLSPEQKKDFENKISSLLDDRILLRISTEISKNHKAEAENMEAEEIMNNLDKFGINLEKIAQEEGTKLREEIITNMAYNKGFAEGIQETAKKETEASETNEIEYSDF